nr:hypothetical protein [Tanacetum cinerariifolium]
MLRDSVCLLAKPGGVYLRFQGPLVDELILEFFSTFRSREGVLDLNKARALQFHLGGVRRHMSWREFILGISSARDFLGITPSYTLIRYPMLRLCRRLIAYNIAGMSQALKKVTVTDLFYLRDMDVGSVNIPYLWLDLLMIDMAELVWLQICKEHDDTWAWVAPRPERQRVAAAGASKPPPATRPAKTMTQRIARLEEDVHGIRGALGEQIETGVKYTSYAEFQFPYVRRTRRRTDDAGLSIRRILVFGYGALTASLWVCMYGLGHLFWSIGISRD